MIPNMTTDSDQNITSAITVRTCGGRLWLGMCEISDFIKTVVQTTCLWSGLGSTVSLDNGVCQFEVTDHLYVAHYVFTLVLLFSY